MRRKLSFDEAVDIEATRGRIDIGDLGIKWRWVGVGQSPQPMTKPRAVEIDGRLVKLYWPERGWGRSRLFMLCPICEGRSRHLYELPGGGLGCHEHITATRVKEEETLFKLRRARRLQKNNRWREKGLQLEHEAWNELLDFGPFLTRLLREEARLERKSKQGS